MQLHVQYRFRKPHAPVWDFHGIPPNGKNSARLRFAERAQSIISASVCIQRQEFGHMPKKDKQGSSRPAFEPEE